ncbi:hypothetical protein V2J09_013082 [Rumex salicifolius]
MAICSFILPSQLPTNSIQNSKYLLPDLLLHHCSL